MIVVTVLKRLVKVVVEGAVLTAAAAAAVKIYERQAYAASL